MITCALGQSAGWLEPPVSPDRGHPGPEPEIVNGRREQGLDAVVSLGVGPISICSGTLVTPRIVLTAAHCSGTIPLEEVVRFGQARFGSSVDDVQLAVGLAEAFVHPGYVPLESGVTLGEADIAVAVLTEPVSIDPIPFRTLPLSDAIVGQEVVSAGFGLDEDGGSGVKRSAPLLVSEIDPVFVRSESAGNEQQANICSGDSGGPQLLQTDTGWVQIAVHSWADVGCDSISGSTRTDVVGSWLLDRVEAVHGTRDLCEASGRYDDGVCDRCPAIDPDCLPEETARELRGEQTGGCDATGTAFPGFGWFRR